LEPTKEKRRLRRKREAGKENENATCDSSSPDGFRGETDITRLRED
jgi:hypothetical protein